jgi:hypothetical protein
MKVVEFLKEMRALAVEVETMCIQYRELTKDEPFLYIGQVEPVETEIGNDRTGKKREEERTR